MRILEIKKYKVRKYYQYLLLGSALVMSHPAQATCNAETLECKTQTIEHLKREIERFEIDNAELQYDNDDLRERLKVTKKKLDLCSINLKNVTVEIQSCGR